MELNADFFDYEKNLSNLLNDKRKIEIYTSPNKRPSFRKRSEEEKYLKYDKDEDKFSILNKNRPYNIKNTDSLTFLERRKRGFSQRVKRNFVRELIVSDISKDDVTESRILYSGKNNNKISGFRSGKSIFTSNYFKKNKKKKKVTFKNKLVDVVQIESYKKYNVNETLCCHAQAKCSCLVY